MGVLENFGVETGQGKYQEEIIYSVALLYNHWNNRMSSYLKHYHLTPAQLNVLLVIRHQGKGAGISQVEIGKKLIATASNLTRLLDKLEQEGLAVRRAESEDRRVKKVHITDKGSQLLDEIWPRYNQELIYCLEGLPVEDQKAVAGILVKWLGIIIS